MRSLSLAAKPLDMTIDILVTALTVYFAISLGLMQIKSAPAPLITSEATPVVTVVI